MNDTPKFDPRQDPNDQPTLMGGVKVPFERTNEMRWVRRGERYVLQQKWARTVTPGTLALKQLHGKTKGPTVIHVWIDVPQGEE